MNLGPLMLGLDSLELTTEEREILYHPLVGGVILFSRNYHSLEQVTSLISSIHVLRQPQLLVAVDQEGGRVQRFRDGFNRLPAVRHLGSIYDQDRMYAKQLSEITGWLMAAELRAIGVDFSFTPVLDLDYGISGLISDRALHYDPEVVSDLAYAYLQGMRKAGMEGVGKHFPGHGGVTADSHIELPVDLRSYNDIATTDLLSFKHMINYGLSALMSAHVLYPRIDTLPASFSVRWLKEILRYEMKFQGLVISDDLDMAGASIAGTSTERAHAALMAGCDMVLSCNHRDSAISILDNLHYIVTPVSQLRLSRLQGRGHMKMECLRQTLYWQQASRLVSNYGIY
jgi:beta-N-acetylhexosaminidase